MIMNLVQLKNKIQTSSLATPLVSSFYSGNVYDNWIKQNIQYGSINLAIESLDKRDSIDLVTAIIYYGDRVDNNEEQIYTDAKNVLTSILNSIDVNAFSINYFNQKFADELAGGYVRVQVEIEDDLGDCLYELPSDFYLTGELADVLGNPSLQDVPEFTTLQLPSIENLIQLKYFTSLEEIPILGNCYKIHIPSNICFVQLSMTPIKELILENGVEELELRELLLEKVVIPETVENITIIDTPLKEITFRGLDPQSLYLENVELEKIKVPNQSVELYKDAYPEYEEIIEGYEL